MKNSKVHSDQKYIEALLNNDSVLIKEIYERFAPKVIGYIKRQSGDESNAQDIIQETLIIIYKQAKIKKLKLTCPFDAYFFLLCKRKWLNELKKRAVKKVTIEDDITSIDVEHVTLAEDTEMFEAKNELFAEMFKQLGNACQELLKTTFAIKSLEEVAVKLGQSYGYVRKKKSLCIGQLTKLIQNAPKYKGLNT